jgi:hypothetical protein
LTANHPVSSPAEQFQTDIGQLIAEIEACIPADQASKDRESRFQIEAFQERARLARRLAERVARANGPQWQYMDGDAHRIREALKLSRSYFRPNTD